MIQDRNIKLLVSQEQLGRISWACKAERESIRKYHAKHVKEYNIKLRNGEHEGTSHIEKAEEMMRGYDILIQYFDEKQDEADEELARRGQQSMLKSWERTFGGAKA
jgi:hypothetical protein